LAIDARVKPSGDTVMQLEVGDSLSVRIFAFREKGILWDYFCNDIENDIRPMDTLAATAGKVRVRIYDFETDVAFNTFRVDVEAESLRFEPGEAKKILRLLRIDSVSAGWLPG
jgi:hypothetical protein